MKKTPKKLTLVKETVRSLESLESTQLDGVAGGATTTSDLCTTNYTWNRSVCNC